jgi:gamma-glutamyltranspeptidase/glutathione hydrolase
MDRMSMRAWRPLLCLLVAATVSASDAWAAWPRPATGKNAMVASAHPLATEAGRQILAMGGNAADAAVAVSFALSVVEPWSSGLGGGAFAVVQMNGDSFTLDMREMAPLAASPDMYVKDGKVVPLESTDTARAAAIPGLVRGMAELHRRKGKLPWRAVVEPAIRLAREGFPVSERLVLALTNQTTRMNEEARQIFLPGGKVPEVGTRLIQANLAKTLERIAESRGEDFYVGETAKELVASVRALGGLWTMEDLAGYVAKERAPVRGTFRGRDILSMGPPSSGGLLLVQMLSVFERQKKTEWNGADRFHVLAEIGKRAFAMRAVGLADPDFFAVDIARFIGNESVEKLAKEVSKAKRATPSKALSNLKVKADERTHTTHFAIVTAEGDGIAVTQTINLGFGNGQVAGATGVVLNNEMDDFAAQPGVPNAFGLVGDSANRVEPKKRPLSSMTPTLVIEGGKVVGALGSPGGSRIISTTFQVLLHVVEDGMNPADALGAPRVHHQWYPEHLWVEPFTLSPEARASLTKRGHTLHDGPMMGNAMAIWKRADGVLEGAADPRGEGSAAGL